MRGPTGVAGTGPARLHNSTLSTESVGVTQNRQRAEVRIEKGNTFTWEYSLDKPTPVTFEALLGEKQALKDTITVAPAVGEKEPSVFFVVDRTAYRPTQTLHFAGFLRRLEFRR